MAQALFLGQDAVIGSVTFELVPGIDYPPLAGQVKVTIRLNNLADGEHGIHIHGDVPGPLPGADCERAGAHFCIGPSWSATSPGGIAHGSWALGTTRHTGDLCNNVVSRDGLALFEYVDDLISLHPSSPAYIVGRTVVVHAGADDGGLGPSAQSKISGNAGARVACAVIR